MNARPAGGVDKRLPALCGLFALLWGLAVQAGEGPHQIALYLSAESRPYQELVMALEASLGPTERAQLSFHHTPLDQAPPDGTDLIVTAGQLALQRVLALPGERPVLATLIPAAGFRALKSRGRRPVSALFIDQPPGRYLDLVRAVLPQARRVGLIISPYGESLLPLLRREAARRGLALEVGRVDQERPLARAMRQVFPRSDALLALADPAVYNGHTLKNLLLASYRQGLPVIAYSRSFVRAGALAAVYTTPSQQGLQLADTLAQWLRRPDHALPPPRHPDYFVVDVNHALAQALGLDVPHESVLMDRLIRFQRERP